ncbi:phage tail assembly protein [Serratia liquefaciens]|uniref:phage tail assembly protein n=1 Tax=Serratia liquefaciens TaxID=614 RepID=UPI002178459D|nr:phage tail assembly protein [Serratia liquefaciens]CAI1793541.1 Mu-like prophage FluMu protein gp41 [Serratia liquefaciens]HEJ7945908.1 phage tail assembly protein [Serratia liquefaciens]
MAKMTVTLIHGLVTGKGSPDEATHMDVELRELTTQDVVESQLASERVVLADNGKAVAYCSEVMMGLEMLRRQIAAIGSIPGPLSLKQIYQLHPEDLKLLTKRADDIDGLLTEVSQRGRTDAAGDGAQ